MFNIEDLLNFGEKKKMCPYFTARGLSKTSEIVLCNYPYILDDKVNHIVLEDLPKNSLIMIDEAHNIDSVCLESKSMKIDQFLINLAMKNIEDLNAQYNKTKNMNYEMFKEEYHKLIGKVQNPSKKLPNEKDLTKLNIMPGNIRKISHFFSFVKRLVSFLRNCLNQKEVRLFDLKSFLQYLKN